MAKQQQGKGINSQVLSQAGSLVNLFQEMTGIAPGQLAEMSDEEWGAIADRAHEMKRLVDALPILEKHLQTLISGQLQYEEFVQRVLKETDKAGRKIDRAMMDAFLLDRGYQQHLQLMRQQTGLQSQLQDAELASQVDLAKLDFKTALQLVKLKHDRESAQINQRIPQSLERMKQAEANREASQRRKDLLNNGTKGLGHRFKSFFTGE